MHADAHLLEKGFPPAASGGPSHLLPFTLYLCNRRRNLKSQSTSKSKSKSTSKLESGTTGTTESKPKNEIDRDNPEIEMEVENRNRPGQSGQPGNPGTILDAGGVAAVVAAAGHLRAASPSHTRTTSRAHTASRRARHEHETRFPGWEGRTSRSDSPKLLYMCNLDLGLLCQPCY